MAKKKAAANKKTTAKKTTAAKGRTAVKKKAAVKKTTPAKKTAVKKKAPVKKPVAKKTAPAKKKAPARKNAAARKSPTKKTAAARKTPKRPRNSLRAAEQVATEDQSIPLEQTAQQETPQQAQQAVPPPQAPAPIPQQVVNQEQNRAVGIGHDAIGNAIISGDGNIVVVQNITQHVEPEKERAADDAISDIGPNPYKGLVAFDESDADRFFGRERQTRRLWKMFRGLYEGRHAPDALPRVLPILGPSGSGKSSLARAGLIPELARNPIPGMKAARVAALKPGSRPIEALAGVLARIATNDPAPMAKTREFAEVLKRKNDSGQYEGLRRIAASLPDIIASRLIVFIDQFEEIFSLCQSEDERDAFVGNLTNAANDRDAYVSVIFTIRTDFLEETQRYDALNSIIAEQGAIIPSMKEDELRRAISEPARLAGHPLDESTVDLLINETRDREGALPLLQFALRRIWDGMAKGVEPAETLREIGGVGGALAREAERIYASLSDTDKKITRRIFLGLVQLGEGTRDTRRRAEVQSLIASGDNPAEVLAVLDRFSHAGARLITLTADSEGHQNAEVSHEAIFQHWKLLDQWLEESRDDLRFQRRLDQAARHWESGEHADGLLWRSPDLDLALEYKVRASEEMTPDQLEFVNTSDERQKAERRRQRFRRRLIIGLSAFSALSFAIGFAASLTGYVQANRQRVRAEENEVLANENREKAEAHYEQARSAVNDFFTTVAEDTLIREPSMQPLRRKLYGKAADAFKRFLDEGEDRPELQFEIAETRYRIALIQQDEGRIEEALKELAAARTIQEKQLTEDSDSPELILALSNTLNTEGNLLAIDDPLKALEKYQAAEKLRQSLVKDFSEHKDRDEHTRLLASTRMNIGLLLDRDVEAKYRRAKSDAEAAAAELKQIQENKPAPDQQANHEKLLAAASQKDEEANAKLEKVEPIHAEFLKRFDGDLLTETRRLLLQSQFERLEELFEGETVEDIIPLDAENLQKTLTSQDEGESESANAVKRKLLRDLGMGYYNLASLPAENETDTKPRLYLEASMLAFQTLLSGGDSDLDVQYKLALAARRLGALLVKLPDEDGKITEQLTNLYRQLGSLMDAVAARNPTVDAYQTERRRAHDSLRVLAGRNKDTTTFLEASFATQRSLEQLLQNSANAEHERPHRERLVDLWLTMAKAAEQGDKNSQILVCYERAKEQLDTLCNDFPDSKKYGPFQQRLDGQIKALQGELERPGETPKPTAQGTEKPAKTNQPKPAAKPTEKNPPQSSPNKPSPNEASPAKSQPDKSAPSVEQVQSNK